MELRDGCVGLVKQRLQGGFRPKGLGFRVWDWEIYRQGIFSSTANWRLKFEGAGFLRLKMKRYNVWRHGRLRKDPNRQIHLRWAQAFVISPRLEYLDPQQSYSYCILLIFRRVVEALWFTLCRRQVGRAKALPGMTMFAAQ